MRTLRASACLCLTLSLTSSYAFAQPAETDRARTLYLEGEKAFQARRYEEARTAYLAAWALKKHWQIATNLGAAELRMQRHRDAAEHLAFALRTGAAEMDGAEAERARKLLAEAKSRVGEARVDATPEGADVSVDGVLVGKSPLVDPVYLEPGKHLIEAKALGFVARREEVQASAGVSATVKIALQQEGASQAPEPPPVVPGPVTPPPPEREGPAMWPGFVIGGAGLAVLGAGIGVFAAGSSASSSADEAFAAVDADGGTCEPARGPGAERCAAIQEDVDSAQTMVPLGGVMIGVGGAVLVGGVAYLIWAASSDGDAGETGFMPWIAPGTAGGSFSGRF